MSLVRIYHMVLSIRNEFDFLQKVATVISKGNQVSTGQIIKTISVMGYFSRKTHADHNIINH